MYAHKSSVNHINKADKENQSIQAEEIDDDNKTALVLYKEKTKHQPDRFNATTGSRIKHALTTHLNL